MIAELATWIVAIAIAIVAIPILAALLLYTLAGAILGVATLVGITRQKLRDMGVID